MENFRIALLEDEDKAAQTLTQNLGLYGSEKNINFEITRFANATEFLENYRNNFDLVFMDIELPDGNGMQVAQKLRGIDSEVLIIFVTNMAQYAVKGYEVRAFDFIVKPVVYNNFRIKLTAALECCRRRRDVFIWISNKDGKRRIAASRILYVEVVQHMLTYHTLDGDFSASGSLAGAQASLKEAGCFAVCNQCYLVNLRHVTGVQQYSVSTGGVTLQISRTKRASFMRELNLFLAGEV